MTATRAVSRNQIFFIVIAIACLARLVFLGKSFQGDEFFSVLDARTFWAIPDALLTDTHPPLYFYLLNFWMKCSMNEAFLRLLSVIPGVGLVCLIFLIGERAFDTVTAAAGSLIVALAPIAVWSSQYIRTYSLAAFFMALSVLFLMDIMRGRRTRTAWLAYILASAASIYTFYFSALVIVAQNCFVLACMRRDRRFLKEWFLSQVGIFVLYLPWIPFFLYQRSSYVAHPQLIERVGFYVGGIHLGAVLRSLLGLAGFDPRFFARTVVSANVLLRNCLIGCLAAGVIGGAVLIIRRFSRVQFCPAERKALSLLIFLAVVPFIAALILHQTVRIILMSHYFIASFAFLTIAMVVLCVRTFAAKKAAVILSVVLALYVIRLGTLYQDREMDFKAARDYVKARLGQDTLLVSPSFGGIFDYYFFDVARRCPMEDLRASRIPGRSLLVITYPEKLELKAAHLNFRARLSAGGFSRTGSRSFGDLIVEAYSR